MVRKRRPKRPRLPPPQPQQQGVAAQGAEAGAELGGCQLDFDSEVDEVRSRRPGLKSQISDSKKRDFTRHQDDDLYIPTNDEIEALMPFCCAVCHCSQEMKAELLEGGQDDDEIDLYCTSSPERQYYQPLYHRRCCHGYFDFNEQWAPLCEVALTATPDDVENGCSENSNGFEWVTPKVLHEEYEQAKDQESEFYNDDGEVDPSLKLWVNEDYHAALKPFHTCHKQVQENPASRHAVTILDCFAGVGTGEVILKRLGIDISRVVYVEHDLVAQHVYRYHHDAACRDDDYKAASKINHDAEIQHIFIEKFERLEEDIENIVEEHGPFDIVLGGPPCVDYSAVNANRQGVQGEQGRYMLRFGQLIRRLERLQGKHPLFFLAENVILQGFDNKEKVGEAFSWDLDPIELDAKYFSPVRRKRHFVTNIPLDPVAFSGPLSLSEVGPTCCLESGFRIPAHVRDPEVIAKAQCFMASKSRLDDSRMFVFKLEPNPKTGNYHGRPMTCLEREKLMGYPPGYVEEPVNKLFRTLRDDALFNCYLPGEYNPPWRVTLPQKYHIFSGNYHKLPCYNPYRFGIGAGDEFPCGYVKMAPPVASKLAAPSFFSAQEYAKHLVGLAFSVPVVEHLLRPLQKIYKRRDYGSFYNYKYAWEVAKTEQSKCEDHTVQTDYDQMEEGKNDYDDRKMPAH